MAKSRAELFAKLQPHHLTEPVVQPLIIKIDAAKAGKHEGATYFVDAAKTAPKVEVLFENRYLGEPVITQGVSTVGFKLKSGGSSDVPVYTDYSGDWKMTLAGLLKKDDVIIGATFFINPRDVMTKGFDAGSYPLQGALRVLVSGFAATEDLGKIDQWDEFPSEWVTTKESKEYDTDAPLAPTGCVLSAGVENVAGVNAKQSILIGWARLDWIQVVHNDLTGYNVDLFVDTNKSKTIDTIVDADWVSFPEQLFIADSHSYCYWRDLTLGARYWARIQSIDAHNNVSPWLIVGYIDIPLDGKPAKLSSISTETFRPNIIKVSWAYDAGVAFANVGSYELQRSTDGITYAPLASTKDWTYIDTGLSQSLSYYYRVRAVSKYNIGDDSYSDWLATTSATTPVALTDMDVQATALMNRLTEGGVLSGKLAKASVTADKIYAGTLTTYLVNVVNRLRGCTVTFNKASTSHVGWTAGNITLAKATYSGATPSVLDATWGTTAFSETASSYATALTVGVSYYAYATWVPDTYGEPASLGAITFSTSYPLGQYDIVLAVITCNALGEIAVEAKGVTTGTIINGDHIVTGSIDATRMKVTQLSSISADIGTITAGMIQSNVVGGSYFDVSNGVIYLKGGKIVIDGGAIPSTALDATVQTAISNASAALTSANAANTELTNLSSDSILSPVEKPAVILDYNNIIAEQSGIDVQATSFSITTEKTTYDTAVSALTTYLGTISGWNTVPGSNITIVGETFRSKFSDVYSARQTLLNAIAAKAKTLADAAQTTANGKITAGEAAADINSNVTTIDGGHITTNTIDASRLSIDNLCGHFSASANNASIQLGVGTYDSAVVYGRITFNTSSLTGDTTFGSDATLQANLNTSSFKVESTSGVLGLSATQGINLYAGAPYIFNSKNYVPGIRCYSPFYLPNEKGIHWVTYNTDGTINTDCYLTSDGTNINFHPAAGGSVSLGSGTAVFG